MLVDKVALGRRIKAMRQNLEMTQEEFADRLNCTNSHLGKIENGKGGISIAGFSGKHAAHHSGSAFVGFL